MAKAKAPKAASKSDIVRDYLKHHPTASVHQIVTDLSSHDISQALAQKIKYKDFGSRRRRPRGSGQAATGAAGNESKADSIRRVAGGMGKRVRPRDVIATLRKEGISVSFAQVGSVLRKMGMRRRSGHGESRGAGAARIHAATANSAAAISLDALLAAKKLADQLGSVQAAKQAVDALAKLA